MMIIITKAAALSYHFFFHSSCFEFFYLSIYLYLTMMIRLCIHAHTYTRYFLFVCVCVCVWASTFIAWHAFVDILFFLMFICGWSVCVCVCVCKMKMFKRFNFVMSCHVQKKTKNFFFLFVWFFSHHLFLYIISNG